MIEELECGSSEPRPRQRFNNQILSHSLSMANSPWSVARRSRGHGSFLPWQRLRICVVSRCSEVYRLVKTATHKECLSILPAKMYSGTKKSHILAIYQADAIG